VRLLVDPAWLQSAWLLALRLGPLFVVAPVLGLGQVPVRLRVLLAFALVVVLLPTLAAAGGAAPMRPMGPERLMVAALGETVLGAALAFGLIATFAAFQFGGRVLDIQIGFGVATLFDPSTRNQAPLLGTAFNLLAITLFFAADGHHAIVRALAESLTRVPLGSGIAALDVGAISAQFGAMFSAGLALVAPAVISLLLLDMAFAVAARTMPQMNIFFVSMPLKVVVGLAVMALSMREFSPLLQQRTAALVAYWHEVLP
jgi:flagellar biosynthesis protein FliR